MEGRKILTTFQDLGLSTDLLQSLQTLGFTEATPIQEQTIPFAIQGRDLLGQAQTGTGKTAAFGIPLVEKVALDEEALQALVITPTRELAMQVADALNQLGQHKNVRTVPIYGGQDINRQIRSLKKRPQIIVGTPGRLQDHIRRRTIKLSTLQCVVLDEADEMLQMGFREDIEAILAETPADRQILLFSATMPRDIKELAKKFMNNPKEVKVKSKELTMPSIKQFYLELAPKQKFDVLCNLIDIQTPDLAIIFGRTKKRVDEITEGLTQRGYQAEGIHGDFSQAHRDAVIRRFRSGSIDIMVATDVAARGLDISDVTHVYNFDIPQFADSYVHRIGRTGRAGKTGVATTFVTYREMEQLRHIERLTKQKMTKQKAPTQQEVLAGQQQATIDRLVSVIDANEHRSFTVLAEKLLKQHDPTTWVAATLKLLTKESDQTPVKLTDDPVFFGRSSSSKKGSGKPYRGKSQSSRYGNGGGSGHGSGPKRKNKYNGGQRKKSFATK